MSSTDGLKKQLFHNSSGGRRIWIKSRNHFYYPPPVSGMWKRTRGGGCHGPEITILPWSNSPKKENHIEPTVNINSGFNFTHMRRRLSRSAAYRGCPPSLVPSSSSSTGWWVPIMEAGEKEGQMMVIRFTDDD